MIFIPVPDQTNHFNGRELRIDQVSINDAIIQGACLPIITVEVSILFNYLSRKSVEREVPNRY